MKRKYLVLLFALFLFLGLWFFVASSSDTQASENKNLPEEEGLYDVPGHPKLKLRVFVYHPKKSPAKPTPIPPPTIWQCKLEDPDSLFVEGSTGWYLPNGTHEYRLNKSSVPSTVGSINFTTIASNSFEAWHNTTNVGINIDFKEGLETKVNRATYDGQNIITWGKISSSAIAVNYTWYDQTTGIAVENDTIFNTKYPWAWSQTVDCAYTGFYDAQDILTHELGHRMGLNDAYDLSFSENTMYGYGATQEVKKNTLTKGDIFAVNSIYR